MITARCNGVVHETEAKRSNVEASSAKGPWLVAQLGLVTNSLLLIAAHFYTCTLVHQQAPILYTIITFLIQHFPRQMNYIIWPHS